MMRFTITRGQLPSGVDAVSYTIKGDSYIMLSDRITTLAAVFEVLGGKGGAFSDTRNDAPAPISIRFRQGRVPWPGRYHEHGGHIVWTLPYGLTIPESLDATAELYQLIANRHYARLAGYGAGIAS